MRKGLLAGAAIVAFLPTLGWAQASTPAGAADENNGAAESEQVGLADIVVTAQRVEQSAQRAAVAINVVGGQDIANATVTQVAALSALVPSLTIQQIGGSTSSFIRGVGNFSVSITSDPAVAFNYDGVYVGRINSVNGTFFDLARVEVLKGPQGTLYGRNATAGVINVIPEQPKLGEFSGHGMISYGNYNSLIGEAALNIPIGDRGAVRIAGTVTDRDGYLSNGVSDDKTQALRLQVKVEPSSDLSIRTSFDYTHLGGKGVGFTFLNRHAFNAATGQFVVTPTGIPRDESFLSPASQAFWTGLRAGAIGNVRATRDPFPDIFRNNDFFGFTGEVIWKTPAGTLTVIPAVRWDEISNRNAAGGFPIATEQKNRQTSLETRWSGELGMFNYQLGFFYFNESVRLRSGSTTFGSNINFAAPSNLDTESYAPFARLTANLTSSLRLVGGIRYTHDTKKLDSVTQSYSVGCRVAFTCTNILLPTSVAYPELLPFALPAVGQTIQTPTPVAGTATITRSADAVFRNERDFSKVTYRAAAEFDVAPASMVYASYETGFRSGGFNTSVGFETYEPEYLTAFTVGSKNRFFDNRLQLNLEAFYWRYRNQQVAHPGLDRGVPPRAGSITENVGRSNIKGFEVEARALLTPTTTVSADVQYLDTENLFFRYEVPVSQRPRTNCAVTPSATAGFLAIDCAGLPGYNAPKWTINLALEQRIPVGDYEIVAGADTQYRSERYMGFEYQPEQIQPSSWTSNAQVSFGPADGQWSIAAFVRNIENDRLLAVPFAFGNVLVAYTTPPRTYGVRGRVKF